MRRFHARSSLHWRLPALVTLLIAGVLAVFLWATYREMKRTLIDTGAQRASATVEQLSAMTGVSIRQRIAELRRVAADPILRDFVRSPNDTTRVAAETFLRSALGGGIQVVEVWTTAGTPLLVLPSSPAAGAALGVTPAPPGGGLALLETVQHRVVSAATESIGDGTSPVGFLTVRRPVTSSTSEILNRLVGGGARIQLGARNGVWTDLNNVVPAPPLGRAASGTTQFQTAEHEPRLGAWTEIIGTPLLVWVDFPRDAVLAPARTFLERMSLIGLVFLVAAALVSRVVSARITTPLMALTEASEAIAAGDYGRRVAADRADEIGRLGKAFNTMGLKIEEAHRRLETRVEERERALEALRDAEARHRAIVDVALDSIITLDERGRVTEFNPAAEKTFGYRKEDVLGRELADMVIPPAYRQACRLALAGYLSRHEGESLIGQLTEFTALRADGTEFPVELAVQVVQIEGQAMFMAYVRDITARRKAEQTRLRSVELEAENRRVQEATRLKSEFLANMSHELRTPLNAIIGFSSILEDGVVQPDDPQYKEFVGHIVTGGRHLLQLINDVLDLSKVEAGKLEFRPEPLDLQQVVGEVVAVLKTTIAAKRIQLSISVDEQAQELVLDPARLKQVLYNYLSNALKFTPEGGTVRVAARPEGADMFRLEVADSGIGIAEADFGKLFREFQQLDSSTGKQHAGTGLGLALTKRLVESQGGSVGVRSTVGAGSVFYAILPKFRDAEAPVGRCDDPAPGHAGPAILVIEDDASDRKRLVEVLTAAGYAVEAVATGAQAVSLCEQRAFEAITLDLLLPDQSGLDVLEQIRANGKNRNVPVVVVTIIADEHVIAGHIVSDILAKPLDTAALLASLRRAGVEPRSADRILVVDDDEASARMVAVTLERSGYNVEAHTNPRAALASATTAPPSAIVLDLVMPDLDGFQFIDRLRAENATRSTPLIVWTVKDLSGAEHRQLSAAARTVLQKGQGGMQTLLRELRQVLPSDNVAV